MTLLIPSKPLFSNQFSFSSARTAHSEIFVKLIFFTKKIRLSCWSRTCSPFTHRASVLKLLRFKVNGHKTGKLLGNMTRWSRHRLLELSYPIDMLITTGGLHLPPSDDLYDFEPTTNRSSNKSSYCLVSLAVLCKSSYFAVGSCTIKCL